MIYLFDVNEVENDYYSLTKGMTNFLVEKCTTPYEILHVRRAIANTYLGSVL